MNAWRAGSFRASRFTTAARSNPIPARDLADFQRKETQMEILKKITVKSCNAMPDVEKLIKAPGKAMELLDIVGQVTGYKIGNSDKGEYVKFSGSFMAVNKDSGEMFRSGVAILPGAAPGLLVGALDGGASGVEFAFSVGAKYDPTAVTKYVYTLQSRLAPREDDPVMRLASSLGMPLPVLAAPKSEPNPGEKAPEAPKSDAKPEGKGGRK